VHVVGDRLDAVGEPGPVGDEVPGRVPVRLGPAVVEVDVLVPGVLEAVGDEEVAISRTICSLNSSRQWVAFQLLKPMGGVLANPFSAALARGTWPTAGPATVTNPRASRQTAVIAMPRFIAPSIHQDRSASPII